MCRSGISEPLLFPRRSTVQILISRQSNDDCRAYLSACGSPASRGLALRDKVPKRIARRSFRYLPLGRVLRVDSSLSSLWLADCGAGSLAPLLAWLSAPGSDPYYASMQSRNVECLLNLLIGRSNSALP